MKIELDTQTATQAELRSLRALVDVMLWPEPKTSPSPSSETQEPVVVLFPNRPPVSVATFDGPAPVVSQTIPSAPPDDTASLKTPFGQAYISEHAEPKNWQDTPRAHVKPGGTVLLNSNQVEGAPTDNFLDDYPL